MECGRARKLTVYASFDIVQSSVEAMYKVSLCSSTNGVQCSLPVGDNPFFGFFTSTSYISRVPPLCQFLESWTPLVVISASVNGDYTLIELTSICDVGYRVSDLLL